MKNILLLSSIVSLFSLVSCSSDPGQSEGREIMENKINKESKGIIELVKFKKTNGIKQNIIPEQEVYVLEYSAVIAFQQECWKSKAPFEGAWSDFYVKNKKPRKSFDASWLGYSSKHYNKGDEIAFKGKLNFEKTDNGWRIVNK